MKHIEEKLQEKIKHWQLQPFKLVMWWCFLISADSRTAPRFVSASKNSAVG